MKIKPVCDMFRWRRSREEIEIESRDGTSEPHKTHKLHQKQNPTEDQYKILHIAHETLCHLQGTLDFLIRPVKFQSWDPGWARLVFSLSPLGLSLSDMLCLPLCLFWYVLLAISIQTSFLLCKCIEILTLIL